MHEKTVLYVITKATWGGAQRYVWDLITHAKDHGYRPALAYGEGGILSERVRKLGIPAFKINGLQRDVSLLAELQALHTLYKLMREMRPDVVHINSSKAGFVGILSARAAHVPRGIFTAHGWAFTENRGSLSRALFTYLQRKTVELSHLTIAVSAFIKEATRSWRLREDHVVVIPHGIEPPAYLSREKARSDLTLLDPSLIGKEDEVWVGTIAELHPNKGLDIGVRAWSRARTPSAEWVVLGGGDEEASLKTLAGGDSSIHFLGFVPEAARYLKAFDLVVLPSRTEAISYVLLEAAAAGIPAIGSRVGGIPEVLDERALFTSEDPDALAQKIEEALGDSAFPKPKPAKPLKAMLDETFARY